MGFVMQTDGYVRSLKGVQTAPQLPDCAPFMNGTSSLSNYPATLAAIYGRWPECSRKHWPDNEILCEWRGEYCWATPPI